MSQHYISFLAIKHFPKLLTKSKEILICQYWPSGSFWFLLVSDHDTYFPFVKDFLFDIKLHFMYKGGRQ